MHQRGLRSVHSTLRTCVGCRRRDDRSRLVRVVAEQAGSGSTAVPDPRHRLPGRGAWLHPLPECLELAVRRKAFGRALKVMAPLDLEPLRQWVGRIEQVATEERQDKEQRDREQQDRERQDSERQDSERQDSTTAGRPS